MINNIVYGLSHNPLVNLISDNILIRRGIAIFATIINASNISLFLGTATLVLAIIIVLVFNKHTRDAEAIESKRVLLELYKDISDRIHTNLNQINEEHVVKTMHSLKLGQEISSSERDKLSLLILKSDNTRQLVENPLVSIKISADAKESSLSTDDFKDKFTSEIIILKEFIKITHGLVYGDGETENVPNMLGDDTSEIYKVGSSIYKDYDETYSDSVPIYTGNPTDAQPTTKDLILMVAMRKNITSKDWVEQSLGDWIVSNKKISKITHILGINVETRNIVSFVQVKNGLPIGNRVRFELGEIIYVQEKNKKTEKSITIDEATYWNPQNPIRYIDRTPEYIEQLTQVSTPTENI